MTAQFNTEHCETKHKNLNWAIGLIFTILFACISIFVTCLGFCITSQQALAKDTATYQTQVQILENVNTLEHKQIMAKLVELSTKIDKLNEKLDKHLMATNKVANYDK